jgi:hypothetical protein
MLPFINPCFWTRGASQQILSHTPLCIFYVWSPSSLLVLHTTLVGAVLTVIEACGQRPSCVRRSDLFPYLHSHHNVPFHTTFRYLSNSFLVQPPTQQIVSKFRPGTVDSKLCFRLGDLCTGFVLASCRLELYPYF